MREINGQTNKKVLVAHPNQQHSIELAEALNNVGILEAYLTTVFYKQDSILAKMISIFDTDFLKKINKKQRASLDEKTHTRYRLLADVYYFLLGKSQKFAYFTYVYLTKLFGVYVAKYAIRHKCDAVIMFDYTAVTCFKYLDKHAPNIKRIIDMSSIPGSAIDQIISTEEQRGFGAMYEDKRCRYSKKNCEYYDQEIELTDAFLSPSEFVDRALLKSHVEKKDIYRASYGVNLNDFRFVLKSADSSTVINFVYAGKIEGAKGIHYLINACDKVYGKRTDFKLHLVGQNYMSDKLFEKKPYIVRYGYLNKDELISLYEKMHVFVLPSLWEGKSLSAIEALSAGLCQIVSDSSGVDEIIRKAKAGIVVPSQDIDELADSILWYLENKDSIHDISGCAGKAVDEMSWESYYEAVQTSVISIMNAN